MARIGIQAGDLLDADILRKKVDAAVEYKNRIVTSVYGAEKIDPKDMLEWALEQGAVLRDNIVNTCPIMWEALDTNKNILLEGQLGTMRDIDWGAYPFVTSSSTGAAGLCAGSGVPPTRLDRVVGVVKAYTTAVGNGPFPTELNDGMGEFLRDKGNEYGATTGRPRRTGWFDAVGVRFAAKLNGMTEIALTKLDVLDEIESIKYASAYKQNGSTFNTVPLAPLQDVVEPVYEEMAGWKGTVSEARKFEDLPVEAQNYVNKIEELVGVKTSMVSVGAERSQIIMR
jgi:adenylosuccinate synthase